MNSNTITIEIPKDLFDKKYVGQFIERLEIEKRIRLLDVDRDAILAVADEIKADWWENNRERYLEGVDENHS